MLVLIVRNGSINQCVCAVIISGLPTKTMHSYNSYICMFRFGACIWWFRTDANTSVRNVLGDTRICLSILQNALRCVPSVRTHFSQFRCAISKCVLLVCVCISMCQTTHKGMYQQTVLIQCIIIHYTNVSISDNKNFLLRSS